MSTFDNAFAALIGNEGGYSNNPADPGGETMLGITAIVARRHGYTGAMKDLPLEVAKDIAKKEYWDICWCDNLPYELAFQVFDAVYNGGHPVEWLQKAVGVNVDGKIGPATIAAANAVNSDKAAMRFLSYRLQYYTESVKWPTFGKGWTRRIAANLLRAAA